MQYLSVDMQVLSMEVEQIEFNHKKGTWNTILRTKQETWQSLTK